MVHDLVHSWEGQVVAAVGWLVGSLCLNFAATVVVNLVHT